MYSGKANRKRKDGRMEGEHGASQKNKNGLTTKIMTCLNELGRLGSRRAFWILPYCAQGLPPPSIYCGKLSLQSQNEFFFSEILLFLPNGTVCASAERKLDRSKRPVKGLCKKSETGGIYVQNLETRGRRIRELFAKTLLGK